MHPMNKQNRTLPGPRLSWIGMAMGLILLLVAGCAKSAEELLAEANLHLRENKVLEAQILYEELLRRYPDSLQVNRARLGLAQIYGREGNLMREREQLDYLIDIAGGPATEQGWPPFTRKIDSFTREGRFQTALDEAIEYKVDFVDAPPEGRFAYQLMLADLYREVEGPEVAHEILDETIQNLDLTLDLKVEAYRRKVGLYQLHEQWEEVARLYKEFLERHPDTRYSTEFLFNVAIAMGRLDRPEQEQSYFDRSVQILEAQFEEIPGANEQIGLLLRLGGMHLHTGRAEEAEAYFHRIIKEYPGGRGQLNARFMMVQAAMAREQPEEALAWLDEIVRLFPRTREGEEASRMAETLRRELAAGDAPATTTLTVQPATGAAAPPAGDEPTTPILEMEPEP